MIMQVITLILKINIYLYIYLFDESIYVAYIMCNNIRIKFCEFLNK